MIDISDESALDENVLDERVIVVINIDISTLFSDDCLKHMPPDQALVRR
jgi:hypothetical protein